MDKTQKKFGRKKALFAVILYGLLNNSAFAQTTLLELYQQALKNDPSYLEALAQYEADKEAYPQAIAKLLPAISGAIQTTGVDTELPSFPPQTEYNTHSYTISLAQPIFHVELWSGLKQADQQRREAFTKQVFASQDLISRFMNQYFAVLGSLDDLYFTKAQRKAFARELDQAQHRFDVGLIAITDVLQARARLDSAIAQEVAALNDVSGQVEQLKAIVGVDVTQIAPLSEKIPLNKPVPANKDTWVETALENNLELEIAKRNMVIAKYDIVNANAGHIPSLDLNASADRTKNAPPFNQDTYFTKRIGVNINVPLFAGGAVMSRSRQAIDLYVKAQREVDLQRATRISNTIQAYLGVISNISEVQSLAQAVVSNKSALDATEAAYEVGTRTIVDVLNQQSQLLNAERDLAKARYNYVLQGIKLKKEAGNLSIEDVIAVNQYIIQDSSKWPEKYHLPKEPS